MLGTFAPLTRLLVVLALSVSLPTWSQTARPPAVGKSGVGRSGGDFSNSTTPKTKVPAGVILVKGAWSSASDSVTPVPESGSVANNIFTDAYFGIAYPLPTGWIEKYKGPPPSEGGRYVLAQIRAPDTRNESSRGNILITAEDMFFTPLPAANALELVDYTKDNLQAGYKIELPPTQTTISGRPFTFFAYWSPVAQLHWYVLAAQIRCHTVELAFTSRDTKLLARLVQEASKMAVSAGAEPVCVKDYANDENVIERVNPVFTDHRYNPVPVRIIIDKSGKVKHIHFLSAFPDQAKAITDALQKWKFKPYIRDKQLLEVETGIMFGRALRPVVLTGTGVATE